MNNLDEGNLYLRPHYKVSMQVTKNSNSWQFAEGTRLPMLYNRLIFEALITVSEGLNQVRNLSFKFRRGGVAGQRSISIRGGVN